jgi:hypothetical protein
MWKTRKLTRDPSRSRSPPPRQRSNVERIDSVIQSLRKLSYSLEVSPIFFPDVCASPISKNLPGSVSSPVAVNSLPARPNPLSERVRETESRLRNDLARNREELMAAIFKAAEIEMELETFDISVSPHASQAKDGIHPRFPLHT